MAKRKNNSNVKKLCSLVAAVFGLIAIAMIFLPAINIFDKDINGIKAVFGYSETTGTIIKVSKQVLELSIGNLITYILVVIGLVISLLTLTKIGRKNKVLPLFATVVFIAAGVLFFFQVNFVVLSTDLLEMLSIDPAEYIKQVKSESTLLVGPIVAGVLSIIAGLCSAVSGLLTK